MAEDDKNTTEATAPSPFASATFNFTAPNAGGTSQFPSLIGLSQAIADAQAAKGGDEEDEEEEEPLAPEVQARVNYLRKLQEERETLIQAMLEERKVLEKKYAALYAPLYVKRASVVSGQVDVEEKEEGSFVEKPGTPAVAEEGAPPSLSIPDFWLKAMLNHSMLAGMVEPDDVPAMQYLTEIRCVDKEDYTGFTLEFSFAQPNPFFTNAVLSKSYEVPNLIADEEPVLQAVRGTDIQWLPKKNLCVQEKKMKPKGKSRGGVVVKQVPKDSFFNWFEALDVPEDPGAMEEDEYEELMGRVEYDFAIASILRQDIVPEAVKWFCGEGEEDEESEYGDSEDEDYEEEDSEDDESSSSEEEEQAPRGGRRQQAGRPAPRARRG